MDAYFLLRNSPTKFNIPQSEMQYPLPPVSSTNDSVDEVVLPPRVRRQSTPLMSPTLSPAQIPKPALVSSIYHPGSQRQVYNRPSRYRPDIEDDVGENDHPRKMRKIYQEHNAEGEEAEAMHGPRQRSAIDTWKASYEPRRSGSVDALTPHESRRSGSQDTQNLREFRTPTVHYLDHPPRRTSVYHPRPLSPRRRTPSPSPAPRFPSLTPIRWRPLSHDPAALPSPVTPPITPCDSWSTTSSDSSSSETETEMNENLPENRKNGRLAKSSISFLLPPHSISPNDAQPGIREPLTEAELKQEGIKSNIAYFNDDLILEEIRPRVSPLSDISKSEGEDTDGAGSDSEVGLDLSTSDQSAFGDGAHPNGHPLPITTSSHLAGEPTFGDEKDAASIAPNSHPCSPSIDSLNSDDGPSNRNPISPEDGNQAPARAIPVLSNFALPDDVVVGPIHAGTELPSPSTQPIKVSPNGDSAFATDFLLQSQCASPKLDEATNAPITISLSDIERPFVHEDEDDGDDDSGYMSAGASIMDPDPEENPVVNAGKCSNMDVNDQMKVVAGNWKHDIHSPVVCEVANTAMDSDSALTKHPPKASSDEVPASLIDGRLDVDRDISNEGIYMAIDTVAAAEKTSYFNACAVTEDDIDSDTDSGSDMDISSDDEGTYMGHEAENILRTAKVELTKDCSNESRGSTVDNDVPAKESKAQILQLVDPMSSSISVNENILAEALDHVIDASTASSRSELESKCMETAPLPANRRSEVPDKVEGVAVSVPDDDDEVKPTLKDDAESTLRPRAMSASTSSETAYMISENRSPEINVLQLTDLGIDEEGDDADDESLDLELSYPDDAAEAGDGEPMNSLVTENTRSDSEQRLTASTSTATNAEFPPSPTVKVEPALEGPWTTTTAWPSEQWMAYNPTMTYNPYAWARPEVPYEEKLRQMGYDVPCWMCKTNFSKEALICHLRDDHRFKFKITEAHLLAAEYDLSSDFLLHLRTFIEQHIPEWAKKAGEAECWICNGKFTKRGLIYHLQRVHILKFDTEAAEDRAPRSTIAQFIEMLKYATQSSPNEDATLNVKEESPNPETIKSKSKKHAINGNPPESKSKGHHFSPTSPAASSSAQPEKRKRGRPPKKGKTHEKTLGSVVRKK